MRFDIVLATRSVKAGLVSRFWSPWLVSTTLGSGGPRLGELLGFSLFPWSPQVRLKSTVCVCGGPSVATFCSLSWVLGRFPQQNRFTHLGLMPGGVFQTDRCASAISIIRHSTEVLAFSSVNCKSSVFFNACEHIDPPKGEGLSVSRPFYITKCQQPFFGTLGNPVNGHNLSILAGWLSCVPYLPACVWSNALVCVLASAMDLCGRHPLGSLGCLPFTIKPSVVCCVTQASAPGLVCHQQQNCANPNLSIGGYTVRDASCEVGWPQHNQPTVPKVDFPVRDTACVSGQSQDSSSSHSYPPTQPLRSSSSVSWCLVGAPEYHPSHLHSAPGIIYSEDHDVRDKPGSCPPSHMTPVSCTCCLSSEYTWFEEDQSVCKFVDSDPACTVFTCPIHGCSGSNHCSSLVCDHFMTSFPYLNEPRAESECSMLAVDRFVPASVTSFDKSKINRMLSCSSFPCCIAPSSMLSGSDYAAWRSATLSEWHDCLLRVSAFSDMFQQLKYLRDALALANSFAQTKLISLASKSVLGLARDNDFIDQNMSRIIGSLPRLNGGVEDCPDNICQTCSPYTRTAQSGTVFCSDNFCQSWSSSTRAAQKLDTQAYARCASGALPAATNEVAGKLAADQSESVESGNGRQQYDLHPHDHRNNPKKMKTIPKFNAVTFNGNSWSTCKSFLSYTTANIVFIQEHKLLGEGLAAGKLWAMGQGWTGFFCPALATHAGGRSGGVAILVRNYIQAWVPEELCDSNGQWWPGRGQAVVVAAGGTGPVLCVSAYFYTNSTAKSKMHQPNMGMLAAIGRLIADIRMYILIGADWQMSPEVLRKVTFLRDFELTIRAENSGLGSCVASNGSSVSCIDFFVLSYPLADVIEDVYYCPFTAPRPHRPTYLGLRTKPKCAQVLIVVEPPRLPVDPPVGPIVPPSDWSNTKNIVHEHLQGIDLVDSEGYHPQLSDLHISERVSDMGRALGAWLGQVETDLIATVGAQTKAAGRGGAPVVVTANVINTFRCSGGGDFLASKALRWVQCRFLELARAVDAWKTTAGFPGVVSVRRRVVDLCNATLAQGYVRSPLNRFKLWDMRRVWHPMLKSLVLQIIDLNRVTGFRRPNPVVCKAICTRAANYANKALISIKELESNELFASKKAWKSFIDLAEAASASIGHKYSKVPLQLNRALDLGTPKSRDQLLQDQVNKWSAVWKESGAPTPLSFPKVLRAPDISVPEMREASTSFKRNTCARGGIHPRHIALLPDEAIQVLLDVLHAAEAVGRFPPQIDQTFMSLLPKPSGGFRTIGLYTSIYRVWAKARAALTKQWERSHASGEGFAAGENRAAVDVVWRHSFAAEAADADNKLFAVMLFDIAQCYDILNHRILIDSAHRHEYPMSPLRMSISAYRAPRRITLSGVVSRLIMPEGGIIAGNAMATTELRCYVLDVVNQHNHANPSARLNLYIDDCAVDATADDKFSLAETLIKAGSDLAHSMESCLEMTFAGDKSAILSNSLAAANLIRKGMGTLGGEAIKGTRSLGFDFWAASPGKPKMRVRRSRFARLAARRGRLRKCAKASRSLGSKLYVCGVVPSILFDAPVYGHFGRSLKKFRTEVGMATGLLGKKRDPDMAFAFGPEKDPEVKAMAAVVLRFCSEIWGAALGSELRDPAGTRLGALAAGIAAYLRRNPVPPKDVKGPMSALHKALAVAGWQLKSPFVWLDRDGNDVNTLYACPKRVLKAYKSDLSTALIHRYLSKLHNSHGTPESAKLLSDGLLLEPATAVFKKFCSRRDFRSAYTLVRIMSGGIFTKSTLFQYGYDVDFTCGVCNQAKDSVFHQCFTCSGVESKAQNALGWSLYNHVLSLGPDSLLGTRGLMPHPVLVSKPSNVTKFEEINFIEGEQFDSDIHVFADGSCLYPSHKPLSRAGFAVAQVNAQGDVLRALFGCLPASLPQTPLNGEYAAFLACLENVYKGTYVGDCQAVISAYRAPLKHVISHKSSDACWWKTIVSRYGTNFRDRVLDVVKTKAHRSNVDQLDEQELYMYTGNNIVDTLAKRGAALHAPAEEDVESYLRQRKELKSLLYHMVDVLSCNFDARLVKSKLVRLPPGVVSEYTYIHKKNPDLVDNAYTRHQIEWNGNMWFCRICFARSRTLLPTSSLLRSRCSGSPPFEGLVCQPNGHVLKSAAVQGGGVFLFCSKCFHYASPHPRKLNSVCLGIPAPSEKWYIERRVRPVSRLRLSSFCAHGSG